MPLASIWRYLPSSKHPLVSRKTIRKWNADAGIKYRRSLRNLPLIPHHRYCWLDICRPQGSWSVTDWRHATLLLLSNGIQQLHKMLQCGKGFAELHDYLESSTMTARRWVENILMTVVSSMLSSFPEAIYQQDNARSRTAWPSQRCLQEYDELS